MTDVYIDPKIVAVRRLYTSAVSTEKQTYIISVLLDNHAQAIHTAFNAGDDAVAFHLGSWYQNLIGKSPAQIMATKLSLAQVHETVAREYGFKDWQSVQALGKARLDKEFESAVELVITGNLDGLRDQLKDNVELVKQHSNYGHASTLLHYVGANGVESHRQITPLNCADIAQCLLDYGADVNAGANMYGGNTTTLELVLTSAHPANAGVTDAVAKVLRDAGGK